MHEVIQNVLATEAEARGMVAAARAEAERILAEAQQQSRDVVARARQDARAEAARILEAAANEAEGERQNRLKLAAAAIKAEVRLEEDVRQRLATAAVRCVCGLR
jgi:vacuolar-type H+-ATPase subunit H